MRYIISLLLATTAVPALAEVPHVVTDMPPVHSIAAAVMGDLGDPVLLLEKGASPHGFQLRPSQMAAVSEADLVLWIGPEISPWLEKALANRSAKALTLALLSVPSTHVQNYLEPNGIAEAHDHDGHEEDHNDADHTGDEAAAPSDHDHDHASSGVDPHAWLDPENGRSWARLIAGELSRLDPENAATYAANAEAAVTAITGAEAEAAARLTPVKDRPIITFHDAYGYFTAHFGLNSIGTVAAGDAATPGARHLAGLQAKAQSTACLFPEAQLDPALLTRLAEATGAKIGGVLDPEGSTLEPGPDLYPTMIKQLAETIATCP